MHVHTFVLSQRLSGLLNEYILAKLANISQCFRSCIKQTEPPSHIPQSSTMLFLQRVHFKHFLKGVFKIMLLNIYLKIKQCPRKRFKEKRVSSKSNCFMDGIE